MTVNENGVEVQFTSDTTGLQQGAFTASTSIKESIDRMNQSFAKMGEQIKSSATASNATTKSMADSISGSFATIGSSIQSALAPILIITAAFQSLKAAISATTEDADAVRELMRAFGMASDTASDLYVGLRLAGVDTGTYAFLARKLNMELKSSEETFKTVKIAVRDANGQMLDQQTILMNSVNRLKEFKAGYDQNAVAMQLWGRSAREVFTMFDYTNEVQERGNKLAKELGLIQSGEGLAAVKAYQMQMRELGVVWDAILNKLGEALMPAMIELGKLFTQFAIEIMPTFVGALRYLMMALEYYVAAERTFHAIQVTGFAAASRAVQMFQDVINALRFNGSVKAEFQKGVDDIVIIFKKGAANIAQIKKDMDASLAKIKQPEDKAPAKPIGGTEVAPRFEDEGKADSKMMAKFEAELQAAKLTYMQENNLREMAKADEMAYWSAILAKVKMSADMRVEIAKKVSALEMDLLKKAGKDREALLKEQINENEKASLRLIKNKQEEVNQEVAIGKTSQAQAIVIEQDFENQRYAIAMEAQNKRIALAIDDPDNPLNLQKERDKALEIERNHFTALKSIQTKAVTESVARNKAMLAPITQAIQGTVQGMLQGTLTLQQGIKNLLQSMIATWVSHLAELAQKWAAEKMTEFMIAQSWAQATGAMQTATAAENAVAASIATKTSALMQIPAIAGIGAGQAAASVAAIPVTGWAMAPAVYAETFAMIMGGMASVAAEQGYDVPAGVNPVTQLHQREMVLPASQADVIRNMASGGGGSGANVHFNVSAMDADSVKKFFAKNKTHLVKALNQASRNGLQLNQVRGTL